MGTHTRSMKKHLLLVVGAVSFLLGMCSAPEARSQERPPARFDHVVRNDFFAGFAGDAAALERAMTATAEVLAAEPNHAQALVWRGAGMFGQAGAAFRSGDRDKGMQLWTESLAMMDRAVGLEPDSIGVRIPRGATLMTAARFVPEQMKMDLVKRALSDYERAFELQKESMERLSMHAKGELLMGLADLNESAGNAARSREFLDRVTKEMPGTPYGRRAQLWLEGKLPPQQRTCAGCHSKAE